MRMEQTILDWDNRVGLEILGNMPRHLRCKLQLPLAASQIQSVYSMLLKTCEFRLAGGDYIPILESYHKLLTKFKRNQSEAHKYYHEMIPLIDLIRMEGYIVLSADFKVRELYVSMLEGADGLYQAYMDVAR